MSLLTVERSSPSVGSASESDPQEVDDPQAEERSRSSSVEGFLATKSIAVGLGHRMQWRMNSAQYQAEDYAHLRALVQLIRPPDVCKLAVELESRLSCRRYFVIVARMGVQDTEESTILGVDWVDSRIRVGLVFPIWRDVHVVLDGDGGFSISSGSRRHIFKPVSVQCMWAAFQSLHKACETARLYNYFPASLSHTWIGYYLSEITDELVSLNEWNMMAELESVRPETPPLDPRQLVRLLVRPSEKEIVKQALVIKLKDVMMKVDLETITSKQVRQHLESAMKMDLSNFKSFIDEQIIKIFGQMENPSQILDYLFLGSEWNASNLEELKELGIGHILNISREIDNFFPGEFKYKNIRVFDNDQADLLRCWDDTFRFIHTARLEGSKVLVHCKMGVSRSGSTVIAYVMKDKKWPLDEALRFVKQRRSVVNPNPNFRRQLKEYEGIISARHNPHWGQMAPQRFRKRHHSEAYLFDLFQRHLEEVIVNKAVATGDPPDERIDREDYPTVEVKRRLSKEELRRSWCPGTDIDDSVVAAHDLQEVKASRLTEYLSSLANAEMPSEESRTVYSAPVGHCEKQLAVHRRAESLNPSSLSDACDRVSPPTAKRIRRITSPIRRPLTEIEVAALSRLPDSNSTSPTREVTELVIDESADISSNPAPEIVQAYPASAYKPDDLSYVCNPAISPAGYSPLPFEPQSPMAQTITTRQCDSVKVMVYNLESLAGTVDENQQQSHKRQLSGGSRSSTKSPPNSAGDEEMTSNLTSNTPKMLTIPLSKQPSPMDEGSDCESPKHSSPERAQEKAATPESDKNVACEKTVEKQPDEGVTPQGQQVDLPSMQKSERVGVKNIVQTIEAQFGGSKSPCSSSQIAEAEMSQSAVADNPTDNEVQRILERPLSPTQTFYTPATSPNQLENRPVGLLLSGASTPSCHTPVGCSPKLSPYSSFTKIPAIQGNQPASESIETNVAVLVEKFQRVTKANTFPRSSDALGSHRPEPLAEIIDMSQAKSSPVLPRIANRDSPESPTLCRRSQSFGSADSPVLQRRTGSANGSVMSPRTRRRSLAAGWNDDDVDVQEGKQVSVQTLLEKFRKMSSAGSPQVDVPRRRSQQQQPGKEVAT